MQFSKAILAVAIGSAAVTAWAAPGFGPDLFGMGDGEGRGGHHHRHHHERGEGGHGGHATRRVRWIPNARMRGSTGWRNGW